MIERRGNHGNSRLPSNLVTRASLSFPGFSDFSPGEVPHSNRLRHHLVKEFKPLEPQRPGGICGGPGDIAARMSKAFHDAGLDRSAEDSNDRNCGGCGLEIEGEFGGHGQDRIRIAVHDVASQIRIMEGTPFARISLNQEILSLDISQATEFIEKRLRKWVAVPLGPFGPRGRCGGNERNAVNPFAPLCPRTADGSNGQ